jgi:hypothetical protein
VLNLYEHRLRRGKVYSNKFEFPATESQRDVLVVLAYTHHGERREFELFSEAVSAVVPPFDISPLSSAGLNENNQRMRLPPRLSPLAMPLLSPLGWNHFAVHCDITAAWAAERKRYPGVPCRHRPASWHSLRQRQVLPAKRRLEPDQYL